MRKGSLFSITADHNVQTLADTLGCKLETLPATYLGLPLGEKYNDINIWKGIIEKREKKLSTWKRQYLSFVGRLTLVNNVLDGMSIYLISTIPTPARVEEHLNRIRRNFLWEGNQETKKIHLVKWLKVMFSKEGGGLVVRSLGLHNKSLLFKWHWRFE